MEPVDSRSERSVFTLGWLEYIIGSLNSREPVPDMFASLNADPTLLAPEAYPVHDPFDSLPE